MAGSIAGVIVALLLAAPGSGRGAPEYRLAKVERGDLELTVTAAGALSAVTTVQVGTQVSGSVVGIYADFNERVREGQLIARIDSTLQEQQVRNAQAGLERAQAEFARIRREYERNLDLFRAEIITEIEFNNMKYGYEVARADMKAATVVLEQARQNLAYCSIHSPIDGVVVERNVELGQTVASSLTTPQLFLIAKDLAHMQILASVAESDIGLIRNGQRARFAVQAYPESRFEGVVRQVRLQSKTQENVVNYTVVVEVSNKQGALLPGMTATVDFITAKARNVLWVPNAALRVDSEQGTLMRRKAKLRSLQSPAAHRSEATSPVTSNDRPDGGIQEDSFISSSRAKRGILWSINPDGRPARIQVSIGLTDGLRTEVYGLGIVEGQRVVAGISPPTDAGKGPS